MGCRVSKKLKPPLAAFFRPLLAIGFEIIFLSKNLVIRIQKTREKDSQGHGPPESRSIGGSIRPLPLYLVRGNWGLIMDRRNLML